jgi:hypothetical protein
MPSVKVDLGRYVTLRPRADGTFRVFFQVPARLRPDGWLSLIPLPINGRRTGNLSDGDEVARIQADARDLYAKIVQARLGRPAPAGRTLHQLIREWERSSAYKDLKPRSVKHYSTYLNHIKALSKACSPPDPDPTLFTRSHIEAFLGVFDDRPTTKKHLRKTLRLVMDQAKSLGWRADNPCEGIRIKSKTSKASIWEQADVDAYVEAAGAQKSIALMILLEWEIGQRLGDVRQFRPGMEYVNGAFRFWQDKTDSWVAVQVSPKLRALLDAAIEGQLFLFRNERTGKAYTEERLSKTFAWVRTAAMKAGARYLQLRWLRHSCVVQLGRKGCTTLEISAITGHSPVSAARLLDTYHPRDNEVADNAQRKRGLI